MTDSHNTNILSAFFFNTFLFTLLLALFLTHEQYAYFEQWIRIFFLSLSYCPAGNIGGFSGSIYTNNVSAHIILKHFRIKVSTE